MAKQHTRREDLIVDAVALVDRIEFLGGPDPIVFGFREDGACSVYFGEEPVYQFNSDRALRRAHDDGMIKAEDGKLVRLRRLWSEKQVNLIREAFNQAQQDAFLDTMTSRLQQFRQQIRDIYQVGRQVSQDGNDVEAKVMAWLEALPEPVTVAQTPRVG